MQILNRYFLNSDILENLEKSYKTDTMSEFPTHINECKSVFYQNIDNRYFKLTVINNKIIKKKEINKKTYLTKRNRNSLSSVSKKKIYRIDNGSNIIIDKNMIYLETDKKTVLEKYKDYITKSTNQNKSILLNHNENKNSKLFKIFKKLEKLENIKMKKIFKNESSVNIIARIKLYKLYVKLDKRKTDLLNQELYLIDTISSYKKVLITVLTLLHEFQEIFEEDLFIKVIENLNYLLNKTDSCKKTKAITKQLKNFKSCLKYDQYTDFLKDEDLKITDDIESFIHFIQTREYKIIMKQLEILIKENTLEEGLSDTIDLDIFINKSIKKRYKKLDKTIKKYLDCEDKKSYTKIYKKVEKLYILNQEFSVLFSKKKYYKRKQILNYLKNSLNDFLEIDLSEDITKDNFQNTELECIVKNLKKSKKKTLKMIIKSIKNLKKSKKLFVS